MDKFLDKTFNDLSMIQVLYVNQRCFPEGWTSRKYVWKKLKNMFVFYLGIPINTSFQMGTMSFHLKYGCMCWKAPNSQSGGVIELKLNGLLTPFN